MYGAIVVELRAFYEYHNAQDLWEQSVRGHIEQHRFYNDAFFKGLVQLLAIKLNQEPGQILQEFGEFITPYLLRVFLINHDQDIITLLTNVETEVAPFRNEIQLVDVSPFNVKRVNPDKVEMVYRSRRSMPELRLGIIIGLARLMDQPVKTRLTKFDDQHSLITVERG